MQVAFSTAFLAALFAGASASAVVPRDIFNPPIISPTTETTWTVNTTQTITWDTSNPPDLITGRNFSSIRLIKADRQLPVVLADKFDILQGTLNVVVPWVVDANDYAIVLFGDSDNRSPQFTIKGGPVN